MHSLIQVKNHTDATHVVHTSCVNRVYVHICIPTRVRNPSNVLCVVQCSHRQEIYVYICALTQVKNPINATFARHHMQVVVA